MGTPRGFLHNDAESGGGVRHAQKPKKSQWRRPPVVEVGPSDGTERLLRDRELSRPLTWSALWCCPISCCTLTACSPSPRRCACAWDSCPTPSNTSARQGAAPGGRPARGGAHAHAPGAGEGLLL